MSKNKRIPSLPKLLQSKIYKTGQTRGADDDAAIILEEEGMSKESISERKAYIEVEAARLNLNQSNKLMEARILSTTHNAICPLCLEEISASGFFKKVQQAEGRAVSDLTVTQLNLFHIDELRIGIFNHRQYNLGWGHHHCNIVVKDVGITDTLIWMNQVVERNKTLGFLF